MRCALFLVGGGGCQRDPLPERAGEVAQIAEVVASPAEGRSTAGREVSGGPARTEPLSPRARSFDLVFVGDIIFGRYRGDPERFDRIVAEGVDPFEHIQPLLANAVVVGNLETPVAETIPEVSPSRATHRFAASRKMVGLLSHAGFDALSVANNHHYDLRADGQRSTPRILREEGIVPIGAATEDPPALRLHTVQRDGWRVALVGLTNRLNMNLAASPPHVPFLSADDIVEEVLALVRPARDKHDVVVGSIHWGEEYADRPTWGQQMIGRALIDGGVDVVFGHHPHVLQGIERHGSGIIAYSMGNFLFENISAVPRLTGTLRIHYERPGCATWARFDPLVMERSPRRPGLATGIHGQRVRDRVVELSSALRTHWRSGDLDGDGHAEADFLRIDGFECPRAAETDPGELHQRGDQSQRDDVHGERAQ